MVRHQRPPSSLVHCGWNAVYLFCLGTRLNICSCRFTAHLHSGIFSKNGDFFFEVTGNEFVGLQLFVGELVHLPSLTLYLIHGAGWSASKRLHDCMLLCSASWNAGQTRQGGCCTMKAAHCVESHKHCVHAEDSMGNGYVLDSA